jgi:hypothetical protein
VKLKQNIVRTMLDRFNIIKRDSTPSHSQLHGQEQRNDGVDELHFNTGAFYSGLPVFMFLEHSRRQLRQGRTKVDLYSVIRDSGDLE